MTEDELRNMTIKPTGGFQPKPEAKVSEESSQKPSDSTTEKPNITPEQIESLEKVELSEEDQARLQGWKPLEEYNGDKTRWKDAKRFLEDGILYHKHKKLHDEVISQKALIEEMKKEMVKIQQRAYDQALADIEKAKAELARSEHKDLAAHEKLIKAEVELKNQYPQGVKPQDAETNKVKESPAWQKFNLLNPWASKDDPNSMFLRNKAVELTKGLPEPTSETDIDRQLTYIHNEVRKLYPDLIPKDTHRARVMPVSSYAGKVSAEDVTLDSKLSAYPEAVRQGAYYLINSGQSDYVDTYLKDFKKM